MHTPYSIGNQEFSDKAHKSAQACVYPFVFSKEQGQLAFECTSVSTGERGKVLDGEMGIDRIVLVTCGQMRKPLVFTVQERFRKVKYRGYQDLTITTWNTITNQPSELYKINAGLFLYGFYDESSDTVVEWVMVNTASMLLALASKRLSYTTRTNPRSGQEFIGVKFTDLYLCNSMVACFVDGKSWRTENKR